MYHAYVNVLFIPESVPLARAYKDDPEFISVYPLIKSPVNCCA